MINYFNNFISDSGILFILVIIDTILAISYKVMIDEPILSNKLLGGLLRNIVLAFVPALLNLVSYVAPRNDAIYSVIAMIVTIMLGYGMLISILANINLLGIKYPKWLINALRGEIISKTGIDITGANIYELPKSEQSDNRTTDKQKQNDNNK